MAATKATATSLGMANTAVSGWRASRSTTKVQQALQFIWLVSIPWLLTVAELCVPRRFSQVETTPFIDPRQFEWDEVVTSEWTKVQSELKAVLSAVDRIPIHQEIVEEAKSLLAPRSRD